MCGSDGKRQSGDVTPATAISALNCLSCVFGEKGMKEARKAKGKQETVQTSYICK